MSLRPMDGTVAWPSSRSGVLCTAVALLLASSTLWCQSLNGTSDAVRTNVTSAPPSHPPASAHAQAPVDMTGYWVSMVTADWRFRMVVPGRGEYAGIPISLEAKRFADAWNPATDEAAGKQCEAYGAGVIMQVPERLHISWQDENTLQVQTDAGMQKRLLYFKPSSAALQVPPSWQGTSVARWLMQVLPERNQKSPFAEDSEQSSSQASSRPNGQLQISTQNMLPGLLRKNGVPYSEKSTMSEYWEVHADPNTGKQFLIVTTELTDPLYLHEPYVYNALFEREADGSKWDPTPCSLKW